MWQNGSGLYECKSKVTYFQILPYSSTPHSYRLRVGYLYNYVLFVRCGDIPSRVDCTKAHLSLYIYIYKYYGTLLNRCLATNHICSAEPDVSHARGAQPRQSTVSPQRKYHLQECPGYTTIMCYGDSIVQEVKMAWAIFCYASVPRAGVGACARVC